MEPINPANVVGTFIGLAKELESFADMSDVKVAFSKEGRVYIVGNDFEDEVQADFKLNRGIKNAMREIIARRCGRVFPPDASEGDRHD